VVRVVNWHAAIAAPPTHAPYETVAQFRSATSPGHRGLLLRLLVWHGLARVAAARGVHSAAARMPTDFGLTKLTQLTGRPSELWRGTPAESEYTGADLPPPLLSKRKRPKSTCDQTSTRVRAIDGVAIESKAHRATATGFRLAKLTQLTAV
jgi:hypothetical protein